VVVVSKNRQVLTIPGAIFITSLYLISRLPNLTFAGMMYDESTYTYWGRLIGANWDNRLISAYVGGREPLHSWLVAFFETLFPDAVFAGRFVAVCIGLLSLLAVWLIARKLFSARAAFLAALLYIICPFTLLYDRSAMTDNLLAASALWMLFFGLVSIDLATTKPDSSRRLFVFNSIAGIAGMGLAYGAGLLTRWSASYFAYLLPCSLLFLRPGTRKARSMARWLLQTVLGLAAGYLIYYLAFGQTDGPAQVARFLRDFIQFTMPLSQILTLPIGPWMRTLSIMTQATLNLVTWPLALCILVALLFLPRLGRAALIPAAWFIIPLVGYLAIALIFYDRYMLHAIPPALILAAAFLDWLYTWLAKRSANVVRWGAPLLLPAIIKDVSWHTSLEAVNHDNLGFYGVNLLRDDFLAKSRNQPADQITYIVTPNALSPAADGTFVLLSTVPGIKVLRIVPNSDSTHGYHIFDPLNNALYGSDCLKQEMVYYVDLASQMDHGQFPGKMQLVSSFSNRRGDDTAISLYRIALDESQLSNPCTGQIKLTVRGARPGMLAVVQWQDGSGSWHNVDSWQSDLGDNSPVQWWIEANDFDKGPFRWAVYERGLETPAAISKLFFMPDKTHMQATLDVQIP
jgi:Dolichyl-phosphate-mannose-protein mannosyltransferase